MASLMDRAFDSMEALAASVTASPSTEAAAADIRDTFERVLLAQFGLALLLSIWAPDLTGTALLPISPSARLESAGSVRRGSRLTQGERWVCVRRAGGDIRLSVAHIQGREAALICTPRNPNPSPGAVTQARAARYNSTLVRYSGRCKPGYSNQLNRLGSRAPLSPLCPSALVRRVRALTRTQPACVRLLWFLPPL